MRRSTSFLRSLLPLCLLVLLTIDTPRVVWADSGLVSNLQAEALGLTRAWFSQAQIDRTRHRVENALLAGDQFFVLSSAGMLHAMDAETGETKWVKRFGNPSYPSLGPAANDEFVSIVNGSTLVVLDRTDGMERMRVELSGGAGGGPAMTEDYIYVPMFNGKLEAYSLGEEREIPWYYASSGRVFDTPTAMPDSVTWSTDRGYMYVANPKANGVRYRFESSGQINEGQASLDGTLYATSSNGYLYALNEGNGQQRWRYSTGAALSNPPLVLAGTAFVATEGPALHAVDTTTGEARWVTPDIAEVAAASKSRVYGLNRMGHLWVLDQRSGVPLGRLRTSHNTYAVPNDKTDRIYLVSDTGLVQCLHEVGSDEPYRHGSQAPAEDQAPAQGNAEQPAAPADDKAPAENAVPEAANPFDIPAGDDDPFDFGGGGDTDDAFDF